MNPSSNLFLIGPSGAGKTSIGRRLAEHWGMPFVDLDNVIVEHTGVDIATIFDIEGEAGFRQRESALLDECTHHHGSILATGAGAILDADNRKHLAQRGFVLWLDASVEQLLKRLADDQQRPLLAGNDRRQRLEAMARIRTPLYQATADLRVGGHDGPVAQATQHVLDTLTPHWQPPSP